MSGIRSFGQLLRRAREERGAVLREVERLTGLSNPYLAQLEVGGRPAPPLPIVVEKIIAGLELPSVEAHRLLMVALRERVGPEVDLYARLLERLGPLDGVVVEPPTPAEGEGRPGLTVGMWAPVPPSAQWQLITLAPGGDVWSCCDISEAPPPSGM